MHEFAKKLSLYMDAQSTKHKSCVHCSILFHVRIITIVVECKAVFLISQNTLKQKAVFSFVSCHNVPYVQRAFQHLRKLSFSIANPSLDRPAIAQVIVLCMIYYGINNLLFCFNYIIIILFFHS